MPENTDADSGTGDRHYPGNAEFLLAASDDDKVERYYFRHPPYGGTIGTRGTSVEQARKLAHDEFPSQELDDFELVTDLCEHGKPRRMPCFSCSKEAAERRVESFKWFFGGGDIAE